MREQLTVHTISGNLFEELGLPDGTQLRARVDLAGVLALEIRRRGLSQIKAAELLGISQPDVSNLMRGKVDGFSQDRLQRLLNDLDLEVRIAVGPKPNGQAKAGVTVEMVDVFSKASPRKRRTKATGQAAR